MKHYYKKYNPLEKQEDCKMMSDCIVLLEWASKNRNREASITIIAEETGIPRMTLHWILEDVFDHTYNTGKYVHTLRYLIAAGYKKTF